MKQHDVTYSPLFHEGKRGMFDILVNFQKEKREKIIEKEWDHIEVANEHVLFHQMPNNGSQINILVA